MVAAFFLDVICKSHIVQIGSNSIRISESTLMALEAHSSILPSTQQAFEEGIHVSWRGWHSKMTAKNREK